MFFIPIVSIPHLSIPMNLMDKLLLLYLFNEPLPDNRIDGSRRSIGYIQGKYHKVIHIIKKSEIISLQS